MTTWLVLLVMLPFAGLAFGLSRPRRGALRRNEMHLIIAADESGDTLLAARVALADLARSVPVNSDRGCLDAATDRILLRGHAARDAQQRIARRRAASRVVPGASMGLRAGLHALILRVQSPAARARKGAA